MALGHACFVAKRAGIAFSTTTLATITHSVTAWLLEANQAFPHSLEELALNHMEKQAIEFSDVVISPSLYLIDWMRKTGFELPQKTSVIPLFLNGQELLGELSPYTAVRDHDGKKRKHLIYFGRLEERKGISIFLKTLASKELAPFDFQLTFLGKPASKSEAEIRQFIEKARPDLSDNLRILPNLSTDEAQSFLAEAEGIAVIPSLIDNSPCVIYEVLKMGLPFIASNSGGIPELIHPDDRGRCLFAPEPQALSAKLREILSAKHFDACRPAYDQQELQCRWLGWLEENKPSYSCTSAPASSTGTRDVTVLITHYERPHLLDQNLRALVLQSDTDFEVIVVDDGSSSDQSLAYLARLEKGFGDLRLRVIRQENRYVGAARNEGIKNCNTPYVILFDDDNVAFPNMVEVFRKSALSSRADIITCQAQFFRDPINPPDARDLFGAKMGLPGRPHRARRPAKLFRRCDCNL